ncbi:hypothetical protein FWC31_02105 [Candidatus Saccharibacteria bacterium]|nr:hypothetical protein [Candidatus Saccharibacteria bacterium]
MYLRKDKGFTAGRLRNASTLLRVLGGAGQDFLDLRVRFISAVNSLPDKRAANLMMAAYGLLPGYKGLSQLSERRKTYGQQVGLKIDAIAKHENAAIRELAIQLLTARYTMSPLPFSSNVVPHNAALHEYVEINTLVKDRLWQETTETYEIISQVDDVGWLEISSDIPAIVTSTCDAKAVTEPSSNGLRHRFCFDEPLMRGSATTLTFTMAPDSLLADLTSLVLIEESRAFHEPTIAAKFIIKFIGQQPSVIWQYDHLAIYERPGKPIKQQLLISDESGTVTATFTDLYGGMFSGVAWGW